MTKELDAFEKVHQRRLDGTPDRVVVSPQKDIDTAVEERAAIDGIPFVPPDGAKSPAVLETEAAINKAVRGKPWQQ